MTSYLFVLSIGPVQDFIAAARQTRDLWFGSYLISEISRAAANSIATDGGELIFPALESKDPGLKPHTPDKTDDDVNVANVILAELPKGKIPEDILKNAENAAKRTWEQCARGAKNKVQTEIREDIWQDQITDFIEFNAAWIPLENGCAAPRSRLMHLLAGRKATRDFRQTNNKKIGIPKSSLDGARETVFKKNFNREHSALKTRLSDGEQLCAIGLTKRLCGGTEAHFPSVVRVALDPWIREIQKEGGICAEELNKIEKCCEGHNSFASSAGNRPYKTFQYDGSICYHSRLLIAMEELKNEPVSAKRDEELNKLQQIQDSLDKISKYIKGPDPYFAVLVADGDRMGQTISNIKYDANKYRQFSRKLAEFAGCARKIVENEECGGCMVYAGGDDVLAFLPLDTCIKAAGELHKKFEELMEKPGEKSTLSVGIAIGHSRDTLENLLDYGRKAERAAKDPDRNGLAIDYYAKNSLEPIHIREQWIQTNGNKRLDERMENWVKLHKMDEIPDKAAYDMLRMSELYKSWEPEQDIHELLTKDLRRLLKRKKSGHGTRKIEEQTIKDLSMGITSQEMLRQRANELIIAGKIAGVTVNGEDDD